MSVHTFIVTLHNGDVFTRGEWGRNEKDALHIIEDAYGENLKKAVKKV